MRPTGHSLLTFAVLTLALGATGVAAADYPSRPITLIVPHRAGGPGDVMARVMSKMLSHSLRQPLVIENRPGAGGNIAGEQAAQAPANGYTLLLGNTGVLTGSTVRPKRVSFDPQLDFAPITLLGTQAHVLVVNPGLPVRSLGQLIDHARGRPGTVTFSSSGHGSASHLVGDMFKAEAAVRIVHVPYKKFGPALYDVIGGHVQMMFAPAALIASHVHAGRLRAIAVASPKRSYALPDVATMDELGLHGFDATTWYGLVAPVATPREIVDLLHHTTAAALDDPNLRGILSRLGIDAVGNSPREFDAYLRTEIAKWSRVLKVSGASRQYVQ